MSDKTKKDELKAEELDKVSGGIIMASSPTEKLNYEKLESLNQVDPLIALNMNSELKKASDDLAMKSLNKRLIARQK